VNLALRLLPLLSFLLLVDVAVEKVIEVEGGLFE